MTTSTNTTTFPGLADQIEIATRDAALKAAGLQAQATINAAQIASAGADLQATFGTQNKQFLRGFLDKEIQSTAARGRQNTANVRAGFAGAGLSLSGSAADVFRDEQRKANQATQNVNLQGQQQLNQAEQQIQSLRLQSSQIKSSANQEAQLGLRLADISTHRFV